MKEVVKYVIIFFLSMFITLVVLFTSDELIWDNDKNHKQINKNIETIIFFCLYEM
jgi:hypothetical protein